MLALRRLPLTLCALVTASSLTGCSAVIEALGPRPDATLLSLAQTASADARAMEPSEMQELRALQADQLYDEIERICGRDESGAVPPSCEVDRDAGDATMSTDPLAEYLTAGSVPSESQDLVTSQAIDIAAHDLSTFKSAPVVESEQDLIVTLLEAEFAAVYSLDIARAFVTSDQAPKLDTLIEEHEKRILTLQNSLPAPLTAPVTYSDKGQDFSRGMDYVAEVEQSLEATWRATASEAKNPDARGLIIRGAGAMVAARKEAEV